MVNLVSGYNYANIIYKNCRNNLPEKSYNPNELNEKMIICFNRFNKALEYTLNRYLKE